MRHGNIELLHIDCMEYMKTVPDKHFDLAICDPPYGISINANMGRKRGKAKKHNDVKWDNDTPDDDYFDELFRVSKNQIIWGGNYFWLPPCRHFIFWDKLVADGMSFSDGEFAWTSFDRAIRKFTFRNITNDKIHPTQKPVELYKWLLHNYAQDGMKIIDTHLGSGSIALACYEYGINLVGCEIDKVYFDNAFKRYNNHISQTKLF